MKVILVAVILLTFGNLLMAAENDGKVDLDKYKDIQKLQSSEEEEVKVEIPRPDNTSLLTRRPTNFDIEKQFKAYERLKKSNTLLY
ncbi:MAG: hypothetical protein JXB60_05635 [Candidatus Cloacimonetes bacterium]|nr:hypothetical protein [Candidatus Cloacimonadota bacterium]